MCYFTNFYVSNKIDPIDKFFKEIIFLYLRAKYCYVQKI